MEIDKDSLVNFISAHKAIRNLSAEQLDIVNTALLLWLDDTYEPDISEDDLKIACRVLSVLKQYERNPVDLKNLILSLRKEISGIRMRGYRRVESEADEVKKDECAINRINYDEYKIELYSDLDDIEKSIDIQPGVVQDERIFYSNAIISYVLKTNRENLVDSAFSAYLQSFTHFMKTSNIVEIVKSHKPKEKDESTIIVTMIVADMLFLYDALIKDYCDFDYKTINSLMINRSTSKRYINLWSLIRTKFRRILQRKIDHIIASKEYIMLEYISEDATLL